MNACVCGHARGEHRSGANGKGDRWCLLCACTVYAAHRPPLDDAAQVRLFESAATERARIWDALAAARKTARRGLTFDELARELGLNVNSVRGRLSELCAEGVIEDTGTTRRVQGSKARGRNGRATVYRIALRAAVPLVPAKPPPRVVGYRREETPAGVVAVAVYEGEAFRPQSVALDPESGEVARDDAGGFVRVGGAS